MTMTRHTSSIDDLFLTAVQLDRMAAEERERGQCSEVEWLKCKRDVMLYSIALIGLHHDDR